MKSLNLQVTTFCPSAHKWIELYLAGIVGKWVKIWASPKIWQHHHGGAGRRSSGTAFMFWAAPSPRNSAGGVGRVLIRKVKYSLNKWLRKLFTKINTLILDFVSYLTSNAPKTMILHFPRTSRLSHLPFILPSIQDAYFWLVVEWKTVDWQLPKAKAPPNPFFCHSI